MAYAPTTWVEDVTTLGPTNLNHLELGVQAVGVVADAAIPKPIGVADRDILYYDLATTTWKPQKLKDENVHAAAAIAKSKLANLGIVNADVAAGAAISHSKLALGGQGNVFGFDPTTQVAFAVGGMQLIGAVSLGSDGSFDVSNIPQGAFRTLLIFYFIRSTQAVAETDLLLRFNNDSGGNYDYQHLQGSAAVASAAEAFGQTSVVVGRIPGASAAANLFGAGLITVPYYIIGNQNKQLFSHSSSKTGVASGNMTIRHVAAAWRSNTAITRVQLFSGSNLITSSTIWIYGLSS